MTRQELLKVADPIMPFDVVRMFLGEEPPLFYAEVVARTVIVYAYAFIMVRWIGGRTIAQLTTVEFLLVIALGSAVGDPMFYPDVPVLHALITVTIVVLINKLLDYIALRSDYADVKLNGIPIVLVMDGSLMLENLNSSGLGRSELFKMLRLEGFSNLGEIRLAILEGNGSLSSYRFDVPRRGLPIVPPEQLAGTVDKRDIPPIGTSSGDLSCRSCGALVTASGESACDCTPVARTSAYQVERESQDS